MRSFLSPSKKLYQNQSAPQLLQAFDWPEQMLEELVGIPDILNEYYADQVAAKNTKRFKLNDGYTKRYFRLRSSRSDIKSHSRSLVSRAHYKLLKKTVQ